MRDLTDLLVWLEYGRTSGYIAARETKEQEETWADQLREMMASRAELAAAAQLFLDAYDLCRTTQTKTTWRGADVDRLRAAVAKAKGAS